MPLIRNQTPVRVELTTPGEWVELKPRLSKGDETRIQGAAFKLHASKLALVGGERPDIDLTLDMEGATFIGLEVGIVAWSFPEPLTPDAIRDLASEDYDIITARANELWEPRTPEERGNSSGSTAGRSAEVEGSPPSLRGSP